jgi:signal transduction histidine kinase
MPEAGAPTFGRVVRETAFALSRPKRLVPIVLVSMPLVYAQTTFSSDPLAVLLGVLLCVAFVLVAPLSWRLLFPDGEEELGLGRLLVYAGITTVVVVFLGLVLPTALGMGFTFLTSLQTITVSWALFLVGGWGLGRDIGLEASLHKAKRRAELLALEAEQAQLLALRAHFDPHFLFNTLNAIAEWCREDGETAERAILQLSSMLRSLLSGVRAPSWPMERELSLLKELFALHRIRDPEAFTLVWRVEDAVRSLPIPPMLLLPLVENALKHGPRAGHRGEILVRAEYTNDTFRFVVENPGAYGGPRAGSEGLPTMERRLALSYGGAARFVIASVPDGGAARTRATLDLPGLGGKSELAAASIAEVT